MAEIHKEKSTHTAHMYLFSDGCPTDWLQDGHEETWHTIVNVLVESDPAQIGAVVQDNNYEILLAFDLQYSAMISAISEKLPDQQLRQWKSGGKYKKAFCKSIQQVAEKCNFLISACSFQEKTLRFSQAALLNSVGSRIGGSDGRGAFFSEFVDPKGRLQMQQAFMNFSGYHELCAPKNQMLVMLLTAWFAHNQYDFHKKSFSEFSTGNLLFTFIADTFSGDDDSNPKSLTILRNLVDPDGNNPNVRVVSTALSKEFSGAILVNNFAGLLDEAISNPLGEFAEQLIQLESTGIWSGWNLMLPSCTTLNATPAIGYVKDQRKNLTPPPLS